MDGWWCWIENHRFDHRKGHDTPAKINMEPKSEGLEDDFPFQMDDFQLPAVYFPGCITWLGECSDAGRVMREHA